MNSEYTASKNEEHDFNASLDQVNNKIPESYNVVMGLSKLYLHVSFL